MGILDWMKKHEPKAHATSAANDNRKPTALEKLFAEWTHDQQLAKVRDVTGREPESGSIKPLPDHAPNDGKPLAKKARLKSRDIPF